MILKRKYVFGEILNFTTYNEAALAIRGYVPYKYSQEDIVSEKEFWNKSIMKLITAYIDDNKQLVYKIIINMYTQLGSKGFNLKYKNLYNEMSKIIGISNFSLSYDNGGAIIDLVDNIVKTMIDK